MTSPYYEEDLKSKVLAGDHRNLIGGFWDKLGKMQIEFLTQQGLQAHHQLLDIGCGALRLGTLAIDYLEPRHYFGTDISEDLLDAGYNKELTDRQRERLPRSHLFASNDFSFGFLNDHKLDYAIAQSVFTHLPMNHIRHCLHKLHPHMKQGSAFYATFSICPDHHPITEKLVHPKDESIEREVATYDIRDPYHYTLEDIEYCTKDTPWKMQFLGDWGHPRNLQMVGFMMSGQG